MNVFAISIGFGLQFSVSLIEFRGKRWQKQVKLSSRKSAWINSYQEHFPEVEARSQRLFCDELMSFVWEAG
jgi:hypothetical protein